LLSITFIKPLRIALTGKERDTYPLPKDILPSSVVQQHYGSAIQMSGGGGPKVAITIGRDANKLLPAKGECLILKEIHEEEGGVDGNVNTLVVRVG
jgi:hypothetical protein